MSIVAITASKVKLGGTDYSSQVASATLDVDVEVLDRTTFTSAGWKELVGGLKSATLNIEFRRDTDLVGLQAALWSALGTEITFAYQLVNTTLSTSAPEFQGSVLITKEMIGASVGQLWSNSVSWPTSGSITRDVSP